MSLVEQAIKRAKQAGRPTPISTAVPSMPASADAAGATGEPARDEAVPVPAPDAAAVQQSSRPATASTPEPLPFVELDPDQLRRAGYLPPVEQEREVVEQFRNIKRPLLTRAFGRGVEPVEQGRVIVVTSALPGEGKTFCALNLARTLCLEKDSSVLLIDTDTSRPQITRTLGMLGRPGLVDALLDPGVDIEAMVHVTNVPQLTIIPAGRPCETASELLSSARMAELLTKLTSKAWPNRIVLLDAPPLLVTNEAKTLVDSAGQVVLVVRASATPQSAVLDAISHLRQDRFVGLVLNESETVSGAGYGYGYYGRMYKYGQPNENEKHGE